jgi:DNA-binding transcriptional regulator YdaS (Cro superfamily)
LSLNERYAFNAFMETALEKAKRLAGGASALAQRITLVTGERITSQAVSQWKIVPAGRVVAVERVTGVSRLELRPDLFEMPYSDGEAAHG